MPAQKRKLQNGNGMDQPQRNIAVSNATDLIEDKFEVQKKYHSPVYLGTYRHLQAAIASIDDRLLFMRICEELEARGICYKSITVESIVGGNILRLTDISSIISKYGMECEDFFENLIHCNIRLYLPDGNSQLECTFINPPLVPDFRRTKEEVETDMKKPHTYVLTLGPKPKDMSPSQSQVIAHGIEERILTYCHIYVPVRRFADAYTVYYRNFCNIRTFTYHKLVLSYGDHRELLFMLNWRWFPQARVGKYTLCFSQIPELVPHEQQMKTQSHWNPHLLVNHLLTERFNRDCDLTWLVNYLVNTHISLSIIQNFMRTRIHSTKTSAQILSKDAAFTAETIFHLIPLDENTIRLCYGSQIAMEFRLLQQNQVAIRDCSVITDHSINFNAVSITEFWRTLLEK